MDKRYAFVQRDPSFSRDIYFYNLNSIFIYFYILYFYSFYPLSIKTRPFLFFFPKSRVLFFRIEIGNRTSRMCIRKRIKRNEIRGERSSSLRRFLLSRVKSSRSLFPLFSKVSLGLSFALLFSRLSWNHRVEGNMRENCASYTVKLLV